MRDTPDDPLVEVFVELDELGEPVDSRVERDAEDVRQTLERPPGGRSVGNRIDRDTTRDVAEGFVGSIPLSLLVEAACSTSPTTFPPPRSPASPCGAGPTPCWHSRVSPGGLRPFAGPAGNSRDDATASARTWI